MKSRIIITSLCLLAIVFEASLPASAGARASCEKPFVFEKSAVNTVILPYKYVGSRQELRHTGSWLAQLIQSDTLIRTIPYGSIAAVLLEDDYASGSPECEPDVVLEKLLGKGGSAYPPIRVGNGLVLVWGIIYEQGDDIYLKTFATVIRRDADIASTVKIGDSSFVAEPSARVVSFAPRKVSRQTLSSIEEAYNRANRVYEGPDINAPNSPVPNIHCSGCGGNGRVQAYYVDQRQKDWIHVTWSQGMGERSAGWMRTGGNIEAQPFDKFLPELHFIRASVGYLSAQIATSESEKERVRKLALEDFSKYIESPDPAPVTAAVALQLSGMLRLAGDTGPESWNRAIVEFSKSYDLAPYSPEAKSLVAIGHIYQDMLQGVALERSKERSQELAETQLLKPRSAAATENLVNYYGLLLPQARSKGQVTRGFTADQLQERIVELREKKIRSFEVRR